jgi:N-acetylmuramoyl-L-alanine amidase
VPVRLPRSALLGAITAGLLVVLAWAAAGQNPPPTPLRLLTPGASRTLPTVLIGDTEHVALSELATVFPITIKEDLQAGAITVTWGGRTVVLSADQALASVNGRLVSLPAPPSRIGNRLHVPLEFAPRALGPIADRPIELRRQSRLLIAGEVRVPRVVVRHDGSGAQARVSLDVTPATPHTLTQESGRLVVRFEADALDTSLPSIASPDIVQGIRAVEGQPAVAVELGPRFASFRASDMPAEGGTGRMVIDLLAAEGAATAGPAGEGGAPPPVEALPMPTPAAGFRTIVIDAGHGGDDTGARGEKGTLEKDVTLGIARRLRSALEARIGARVLLTRDDDRAVGLDERAALANNNKADLFVSIHANASVHAATTGAEVFFLSVEREMQAVASDANAVTMPVFGGGTRAIDVTPWDLAQLRHINASAALAALVEEQLRGVVPISPRAIQQGPFRVLVGANMPAVLVEVGYLSNPAQEAQLAGADFQGRVARALADAVVRFEARARGGTMARGDAGETP